MPKFPLPALLLALAALPAVAQYKVVGPDGRVTYTDRPLDAQGRVVSVGGRPPETAVATTPPLPLELREVAARFPATLYTTSGACTPCDTARQLLRGRGIPYTERQILSNEDAEAFERLSGGKEVPVLTLGGQTLRGFAAGNWSSYLDAAGYPRESRLPQGWQYAAPLPVVERRVAPTAAVAPPAAAEQPATTPAASGEPIIRF